MSRFFTNPENVEDEFIRITDKNDIKHMVKVLRLSPGDKVEISDSHEWEYEAVIDEIFPDEVILKIEDKQKFAREPSVKVSLFQGIPKSGKMELIIQKCVELGVEEIIPVFMKRTVVVDRGKFSRKVDRWQKVSSEAVKQCRRGIIPPISDGISFKETIDLLKGFQLVLFPYENEEDITIKDCLRSLKSKPENVAIIIGPEGGFALKEAEELVEIGAKPVSLGKTILRTETAGMAALAMTMYELEL